MFDSLHMRILLQSICVLALQSTAFYVHSEEVSFNRDIRPLLSDRCFACHGPDENDRQADLRLDISDGEQGAYREMSGSTAILPGNAENSEVWKRITSKDESEVMPPPDAHKPAFSARELKLIEDWINTGATYESFWAFVPPSIDAIPSVENGNWSDQPIDQFVLHRLEEQDKKPSPEADRRTLIRRVTFDITGLPPTREDIANFLTDDSDAAYERLVDRLLSSQQYGEHMARYWLDLVRFADTNGMHKDFYRNFVTYRDWVIKSFNENLPYDEFVRYQLAGDLYEEPTQDQLVASGFNRLHLIIDRGTALPEESFFKNVVDRVSAFGTVFMGLTVQCAQCHDHKYDPITQRDYYSLFAFFNNLDAEPETVRAPPGGLQPPFISLGSEKQHHELSDMDQLLTALAEKLKTAKQARESTEKELKNKLADLEKLQNSLQPQSETSPITVADSRSVESTEEPTTSPAQSAKEKPDAIDADDSPASPKTASPKTTKDDAKRRAKVEILQKAIQPLKTELSVLTKREKELESQQSTLRRQRKLLDAKIPKAMVMRERPEVRKTFLRKRGEYDQPGEEVQRSTPSFLPPLQESGPQATRMDLANWLVAADNPLTARTAVNRVWQQFFGVGLVKTSEDLGAQGEVPSHPELLDYLAVSFRESGWDSKALVKQIVMTRTYRQSSKATPEEFARDPDNRLLARGSRFRLDAEMIRDQILATSGMLSLKMYGPSVKPPQPPGLWKAVTMTNEVFRPDQGESTQRRSLYTYWKRAMPPPQMTILNAPNRDACIARRERTNTPSQALLLLNEEEYLKAARQLAINTLDSELASDSQRLSFAFETITSRLPSEDQVDVLEALISDLKAHYLENPELANAISDQTKYEKTDSKSKAELAAWTLVMNTLYNLDETKTRE